jgi:hypothetical protein
MYVLFIFQHSVREGRNCDLIGSRHSSNYSAVSFVINTVLMYWYVGSNYRLT